jgi:hypothetical protein
MKAPILRSSILLALFATAMLAPAAVEAQGATEVTPVVAATPTVATPDAVSPAPTLGAALAPSGVTSRLKVAPVDVSTSSLAAGENVGTTRAMMGAGLAAVVIGLIVGGDVGTLIAVGGALFALIGLYRYMQ